MNIIKKYYEIFLIKPFFSGLEKILASCRCRFRSRLVAPRASIVKKPGKPRFARL
jgi:hypothetical protein